MISSLLKDLGIQSSLVPVSGVNTKLLAGLKISRYFWRGLGWEPRHGPENQEVLAKFWLDL